MKVLVLLGSGVSVPSGLPGVAELTDKLLCGNYYRDAKRHGQFYAERPQGAEVRSLEDVQQLLQALRALDARYLRTIAPFSTGQGFGRTGAVFRASTTYEDLGYLCQRIIGSGTGLLDDAPAGAFSELVEREAGEILGSGGAEARLIELYVLASEAMRFAQWLVATSLKSSQAVGLDLLIWLATTGRFEIADVFTLNHDTLAEQALTASGIQFADGFGGVDGDVRWYDDSVYGTRAGSRVRIFKPHGSINWYSFLVGGAERLAVVTGPDPLRCKSGDGGLLENYTTTPRLLTGMDKAMAYNRGTYADLLYRFHHALREHRLMIVSGYGWGDPGINFRLDDWLDRDRRNRLVLLHEDPNQLAQRSLQFQTSFKLRLKTRQIVVVPKWLCDATSAEIEEAMARA